MDALVPRLDFAALAQSVYLNQAALGLIPAQSLEVMLEHLTQTAQHGNVRLSDEEELRILDELRAAGTILLGTEPGAVAVLGGASAGLANSGGSGASWGRRPGRDGFSQRHAPVACRFGKWTIGDVGRGQSQCQPY